MATPKALTGGTMDVNPQFLNGFVIQATANLYSEAEIPIPVMRFGFTKGRAQVFELLRIFYELPDQDVATVSAVVRMQITTQSRATLANFDHSDLIFRATSKNVQNGTPASFAIEQTGRGQVWDYTDGAGHGIIIAGTSVFLAIDTTAWTGTVVGRVKLLYRFKNISLAEFIGLSISRT